MADGDSELSSADWRKRAQTALEQAEQTNDPAVRAYLRGLAKTRCLWPLGLRKKSGAKPP